ncbi:MAG: hypothetical protein GQ474_08910 [Sulfurimonas sp.]|nr:hypothetical protein [Sulfurimonas sp.]
MKDLTIKDNDTQKIKKQKGSILDPYFDDIKYYYDLGVSISSICKIVNDKAPIKMDPNTYAHFIKTKIKNNH